MWSVGCKLRCLLVAAVLSLCRFGSGGRGPGSVASSALQRWRLVIWRPRRGSATGGLAVASGAIHGGAGRAPRRATSSVAL
ncbi:hypothetical protein TSOC_010479 [Tetrabaena socialis]|uniref:Secreted protein n=1 Tax=Tetrabaena socialis TaxID=47790 RepID=A0A2J7ZT70_9CHLO|nr:hypothetical protein TSOC_010479 [Tetrabaena socialis]|eukprot:PNH03458.1 hypothetical protein TSOC_010479 [Tetrabaena socialis]